MHAISSKTFPVQSTKRISASVLNVLISALVVEEGAKTTLGVISYHTRSKLEYGEVWNNKQGFFFSYPSAT